MHHDTFPVPRRATTRAVLIAVLATLVIGWIGGCAQPTADRASGSDSLASGNAVAGHPKSAAANGSQEPQPVTSAQIAEHVRGNGAAATLVNVWATWCGPCREEFPDLVRFQRDFRDRNVEVMYVSADFDDQVAEIRKFLSGQGMTGPSYLKAEADMAFIDGLDPRWSGALPATFVFDGTGKLVRYWEGRADYDRFASAITEAMGGR